MINMMVMVEDPNLTLFFSGILRHQAAIWYAIDPMMDSELEVGRTVPILEVQFERVPLHQAPRIATCTLPFLQSLAAGRLQIRRFRRNLIRWKIDGRSTHSRCLLWKVKWLKSGMQRHHGWRLRSGSLPCGLVGRLIPVVQPEEKTVGFAGVSPHVGTDLFYIFTFEFSQYTVLRFIFVSNVSSCLFY